MRIIVCAGGTGGHIYPALAIINKIKQKDPKSDILYIGTTDRMEATIVPSRNIKYIGIEMEGLDRKNIFRNIVVLKKYINSYNKAKKIIKEFNPDVVLGVGGYVTAPVIKAANKLGYKTIIHEQNSTAGVTNTNLSKVVDKVLVSMKESIDSFPSNKTIYTGNPRSEEISLVKKVSKKDLGFNDNKKLVVIVMGSLGSITMTEKEKQLVEGFNNKDYNVLLITGKNYYDEYKNMNIPKNVIVKPFLDNLINVLKDTDLIVSRAGASTIAEITAIGLPAILVPSPYVTNNHQYKNAKALENNNAAVILEEKDFSKENLIPLIDKIIDDEKLLKNMSDNSKKMGVTDSATRVYNEIVKLVKDDNR